MMPHEAFAACCSSTAAATRVANRAKSGRSFGFLGDACGVAAAFRCCARAVVAYGVIAYAKPTQTINMKLRRARRSLRTRRALNIFPGLLISLLTIIIQTLPG